MYWDAGVFGGVIETTEGLRYDVQTDRTGKLRLDLPQKRPAHVPNPVRDQNPRVRVLQNLLYRESYGTERRFQVPTGQKKRLFPGRLPQKHL